MELIMRNKVLFPLLLTGLLAACGKPETTATTVIAPSTPATPSPTATAASTTAGIKGEDVFKKSCAACHQTGVAGAPKLGDKGDWGPRIAQGKEVLHTHAIAGFKGTKGMMPAKGGNAGLSDAEVKAGVDYMAASAQ